MSNVDDFVTGVESILQEIRLELVLKGSFTIHRLSGGNWRVRVTYDGGELVKELTPEMRDMLTETVRSFNEYGPDV